MAASDFFFAFSAYHDPDANELWEVRVELDSGRSIVGAIVQVVDETSTTVDIGTDLAISSVNSAAVAGATTNLWGIQFKTTGGTTETTGDPKVYYVRSRITLDDGTVADRTMRLRVLQQ